VIADPVPDDLVGLTDRELLAGGLADAVQSWRAESRRWARLVEFHRRREADYPARRADDRHFALTALQATALEASELWGWGEKRTRHQLNVALFLSRRMPQLWAWCLAGQLDPYLATTIADQARHALPHELDHVLLGERLARFLAQRLRHHDGLEVEVVGVTAKQVRNKLTYEITRLRSRDSEERFRQQYDERAVRRFDTDDGMSTLSIASSTDQVQRAEHRLTLAAREKRAAGDPRTLEQLKADLAIDLLTGTGQEVPVPSFARPIINVTVPMQTLMGIADDPATLSGGQVIPAGLARRIAAEPAATWYRMLTDPAGQMVALSTKSYAPTAPIWRHVVAEQPTCYRPHCARPATECELDHRIPWPAGETGTRNLQPACKTDHKAKHSHGFAIEQTEAGGLVLRTPAGFRHQAHPAEQPVSDRWPDVPEIQFTATELVLAIQELRDRRDIREAEATSLEWEHTLDASLRQLLGA